MATILIVDDDAANRKLLVVVLQQENYHVIQAADGAEALALVERERPNLVISDILMPTMDGYEFVRRLRSLPAVAATEVIFYSAHYLEREARHLARACGVTRVLVKPCEPDDILAAVREALDPNVTPPQPVNFVYSPNRFMPAKLRAFLDFAVPRLRERLAVPKGVAPRNSAINRTSRG